MLHVENMRGVAAATWDGLLLQSPGGGHVLQTYAWGEFKKTQGWRPLRLALKDGDRVVGVGQVLLRQGFEDVVPVQHCALRAERPDYSGSDVFLKGTSVTYGGVAIPAHARYAAGMSATSGLP